MSKKATPAMWRKVLDNLEGIPIPAQMRIELEELAFGSRVTVQALTETRWYAMDKDGIATLCADKEDAINNARRAQKEWPHLGPYVAVLMRADEIVGIGK